MHLWKLATVIPLCSIFLQNGQSLPSFIVFAILDYSLPLHTANCWYKISLISCMKFPFFLRWLTVTFKLLFSNLTSFKKKRKSLALVHKCTFCKTVILKGKLAIFSLNYLIWLVECVSILRIYFDCLSSTNNTSSIFHSQKLSVFSPKSISMVKYPR